MALTTDGYETATYVRPRSPQLGYTVLSPPDDVFLLKDAANSREWLVDVDDGTEHRVARVESELAPANPRALVRVRHREGRQQHLHESRG